jgi:hypothetical protein
VGRRTALGTVALGVSLIIMDAAVVNVGRGRSSSASWG